ncbi:hypothetical protein K461DRAFT_260023, partial [Myriangium duriaei CBS 260.36]
MGYDASHSHFANKMASAPPGWFFEPVVTPKVDLSGSPTGPYFMYGSLMDLTLLVDLLGLIEEPELRPAYIVGYHRKMWGPYPALLKGPPGAIVEGAVYRVQSEQEAKRLARYETRKYKARSCAITYTDGKQPAEEQGHTFRFFGGAEDLNEGSFDLRTYLKTAGR